VVAIDGQRNGGRRLDTSVVDTERADTKASPAAGPIRLEPPPTEMQPINRRSSDAGAAEILGVLVGREVMREWKSSIDRPLPC